MAVEIYMAKMSDHMEAGEITTQDRELAIGMIEDYEERLESILPRARGIPQDKISEALRNATK